MGVGKKAVIGSIFFLAIALTCNSYVTAQSVGSIATIIATKGDVLVDLEGDGRWIPAKVGTQLKGNAKLKTDNRAKAEIAFDRRKLNVVKISGNTTVVIDKRSRMQLFDGKILAHFRNLKSGSTFEVKTPTAICGIRGSMMGVKVFDIITRVFAFQGFVYARGIGRDGSPLDEMKIPVGSTSMVSKNRNPRRPMRMTDSDEEIWETSFDIDVGSIVMEEIELEEEPPEPERPEASPSSP